MQFRLNSYTMKMVEPKINSRAFYCGQFYVPDPPSLFAEQEKLLKEHVGKTEIILSDKQWEISF